MNNSIVPTFNNPPLRNLLSESELISVDAYLRRFNLMLSTVVTLNQTEKQELVEGHRALCRLFYSTLGIDNHERSTSSTYKG
jgi:hypothetical protein